MSPFRREKFKDYLNMFLIFLDSELLAITQPYGWLVFSRISQVVKAQIDIYQTDFSISLYDVRIPVVKPVVIACVGPGNAGEKVVVFLRDSICQVGSCSYGINQALILKSEIHSFIARPKISCKIILCWVGKHANINAFG